MRTTLARIFRRCEAVMASRISTRKGKKLMRVLAESPTLQDAVETLGINVTTLWRKRKRYKIC